MADQTPLQIDDDDDNIPTEYEGGEEFDYEVAIRDGQECRQIQAIKSAQLVPQGHKIVDSANAFGITIKPGMAFELKHPPSPNLPYLDFVRVLYITRDTKANRNLSTAFTLHVFLLRRAKRADLKWDAGELCWLILAPIDDGRTDLQRGLTQCSLDDIIPQPRKIIYTNQPFPKLRDGIAGMVGKVDVIGSKARLEDLKIIREAWLELSPEEADEGCKMSEAAKILDFLAERMEGRTKFERETIENEQEARERTASLSVDPPSRRRKRRQTPTAEDSDTEVEIVEQARPKDFPTMYKGISLSSLGLRLFDDSKKYSFGDHFCGIGGVSAAARKAGLQVVFGNDLAKWAAASYRVNFPEPGHKTTEMHCQVFYTTGTAYRMPYCHIIHFSPPCQPFSPNHTRQGKNDESNRDALLSIGDLLRAHRPRFATLEQTSGLKREQHIEHFNFARRQFTDLGYSVQLQIINLGEHDTSSERKRLIIMACCPGETLPDFPPPTRGEKYGLPPIMTTREALQHVSRNDPLHTPDELPEILRARPQKKPLAKWDEPMRRIIDTAGPAFLHPTGRRFDLAEGLALMGFPRKYKLAEGIPIGEGWRGIGNSVPGAFPTQVYKSFIVALKESDEKIKAFLAPIELDAEEAAMPTPPTDLPTRTKPRPQLKLKQAANTLTPSDSDDENLPNNPLRPLAAARRPQKKQRKVDEALPIKKEAPRNAMATKKIGGTEVIDLTED